MPLLEAALVRDSVLIFLLTIFVFSLFVTQVLRIFNIQKLRSKAFQELLEDYFKFEFQPVVQRELQRLRKELKLQEKLVSELNNKAAKLNAKTIFTEHELAIFTDMTTEELIERLKRSALGHQLLMELGDKAKDIFDEHGKRYEVVADRATHALRSRMAQLSTFIALVLAVLLNIDSIFIAKTYLNSESNLLAVTSQKDAFVKGYNALAEVLKEEGKDSLTRLEFERAFQESQEQLNTVPVVGFPIGWSYFPYSYFKGNNDGPGDYQERNTPLGWLSWWLGILLTGVLAGLGAPFWYDVAAGITNAVRAAANKKPEK